MFKKKHSPAYYALLAVGSILMAIISYSGIFMNDDLLGRLLVGSIWMAVFLGWLDQYKRCQSNGGKNE